jgi:hypothetical protein
MKFLSNKSVNIEYYILKYLINKIIALNYQLTYCKLCMDYSLLNYQLCFMFDELISLL